MRKLITGIAIGLLLTLGSCSDDCAGFDKEPYIGISTDIGIAFDAVYAISAPDDTVWAIHGEDICMNFLLPAPMTRDTFVFYLRHGSKVDSAKISYHPELVYDSKRCGHEVRLTRLKKIYCSRPATMDTTLEQCKNHIMSYYKYAKNSYYGLYFQ